MATLVLQLALSRPHRPTPTTLHILQGPPVWLSPRMKILKLSRQQQGTAERASPPPPVPWLVWDTVCVVEMNVRPHTPTGACSRAASNQHAARTAGCRVVCGVVSRAGRPRPPPRSNRFAHVAAIRGEISSRLALPFHRDVPVPAATRDTMRYAFFHMRACIYVQVGCRFTLHRMHLASLPPLPSSMLTCVQCRPEHSAECCPGGKPRLGTVALRQVARDSRVARASFAVPVRAPCVRM
jgi:hypothetical protein